MIETLRAIIRGALERLSQQLQTDLPPLIAALAILVVAFIFARLGRWLVLRVFKGIELDLWLRRTGLSAIVNPSGKLRATRVAARITYWLFLLIGFMAALNALGSQVTTRIVEEMVLLFPRLFAGGVIVLAGMWLGQYLGRSALIWSVNEDLPKPRRIALAVRALVVFAAVVVAADALHFASGVFLAAFIAVLGSAALAAGLAFGLGAREAVRRRLDGRRQVEEAAEEREPRERSLWNHL